jgi:hypothetical protein
VDPNSGIEVCGKGRGRGTGKGRAEERFLAVERKDVGDSTQNKEFHLSRTKSGSERWEEGEEGLEEVELARLLTGQRMGQERAGSKEETNLTRLPS